ncbi:single-stranded DNA-binding protein [Corynebacterium poyangense]|uniref:Single-stranded DNA-binding protein n=1 Tax=Corynebacterium poyangense TaxID=2684405 RepID=A0A7H0SRU9_9CORY|nr:single-stranded DNA-binding protein [Corynebacterium poyangense]QNQ91274.1 single-stranded DNA-binding protein [Corynebacterium poyangense]
MAQGETSITVIGNLVDDPELRYTPSNAAVANFRIASTPRFYNRDTGQWEDGDALFLTCNAWRKLAENVRETLSKGMRVIVTGRLRQRSYDDREGNRRTVFEIEVDEVGPSLRYATAQVNRNPREGGYGGDRSGGFGGGQQQPSGGMGGAPQQNQNQGLNNYGGFGGGQQNSGNSRNDPADDPWNSAPPAGGFGGANDDVPF